MDIALSERFFANHNKKSRGPVADPGPLMTGVLDRWTPTVNV